MQIARALELWWRVDKTLAEDEVINLGISTFCIPEYNDILNEHERYDGTKDLSDALLCGVRFWPLEVSRDRLPTLA